MFAQGLEAEVREIFRKYGADIAAFSAIGYKEFLPYFAGKATLEETAQLIKQNTRRFAKRQLTWFKREKEVRFIEIEQFGADQKKILNWICNDYFGGRNEHGTE